MFEKSKWRIEIVMFSLLEGHSLNWSIAVLLSLTLLMLSMQLGFGQDSVGIRSGSMMVMATSCDGVIKVAIGLSSTPGPSFHVPFYQSKS